LADQPWHELPSSVVAVLRPALDDVAREMMEAVGTVPAYSRPLEGPFGEGIRAGVQEALRHFLAEIEAGGPVDRGDVYRSLGQGEMRAGRSLESLLSAYRIGARVAWRRFAALGVTAGLDPDILYLLAESIFAYIDVLSAESAEGHALEQSAVAGEAQLRRRRLVRMLVRESPADPDALEAAAADAGWALPRHLAVVTISGDQREAAASRLPAGTIREAIGELICAVVADPDGPGQRAAIERAIVGMDARAGLGTTVDWTQARISFARAQAALELATGESTFVAARENAGQLLLRSDPRLAAELAADRLAPLAQLSPGSRERLTATLRVWLAEQGRLGAVAQRLGIHPQTARYRVGRLRDLLGGVLDDPDSRFWMEVALRVADAEEPPVDDRDGA
jgi:PucR C-terminal helix-turn-helix domain